jgi:hypothetical protein
MQARVAWFCPTSCWIFVIRPDIVWNSLVLLWSTFIDLAGNFIIDMVTLSSANAINQNNYFTTHTWPSVFASTPPLSE